jgi:hypothetical protein
MRKLKQFALGTIGTFLMLAPIHAVAGPDRSGFKAAMAQQYPTTTFDRRRDVIKSKGPLFVIAQDGVRVDPSTDAAVYFTDIVDGQMVSLHGAAAERINSVHLKAGDKVYVTEIDVKEDGARVWLLTEDTFDITFMNQPRTVHFSAVFRVKYPKGYLDTASPADLVKAFAAIVLPIGQSLPEAQPVGPAPQATPPTPPAPPAPVIPKTPVTIAPGETIAQVTAKLGQPQQVLDKGVTKVYIYPNMKVTFTNGLVTDLD